MYSISSDTTYMKTSSDMEKTLNVKFNSLGGKVDNINDKLAGLNDKVATNGMKLVALERRVRHLENPGHGGDITLGSGDFPALAQYSSVASAPASIVANRAGPRDFEVKNFARSRRTLKIFPIGGKSDPELIVNLVDFLITVLGLPKSIANGGAIETIRRLAPSRFFNDEILVVFKEVSVRDTVIGSTGMLSEMRDKATNRSTAGIRVDVPEFLRSTEKILEEYGRRVRAIHGKGTKHHIKFDDGETTIYLNIRKSGDDSWTRVYGDQAREWVKRMRMDDRSVIEKKFHSGKSKSDLDHRGQPSGGPSQAHQGDQVRLSNFRDSQMGKPKTSSWTGRAGSASAPCT